MPFIVRRQKRVSKLPYDQKVLSFNPAGYWRAGEASGALLDSSGNGRHGTWDTEPTRQVSDYFGGNGAVAISGDRAVIPDAVALRSLNATMAVLVKTTDTTSGAMTVMKRGSYELKINNGSVQMLNGYNAAMAGGSIADGQWHLIVAVWDVDGIEGGPGRRLYIDGTQVNTGSNSGGSGETTGVAFGDAALNNTSLDEGVFFGTVLVASQANELYAALTA